MSEEKRSVSENIAYKAQPHKPYIDMCFFNLVDYICSGGDMDEAITMVHMPNIMECNKFEGFKICCGQCFCLDKTDAIMATRNVKCAMCCYPMWKMCCP